MKTTSYALTVTLLAPGTTSPIAIDVITVDRHKDIVSASVEAVDVASKQLASGSFDYEALTATVGESAYMDMVAKFAATLLVTDVSKTIPAGAPVRQYLVHATYSNYPEGGAWSDWVQAIDTADATLQAKFILADNELNGPVAVSQFPELAGYMEDETVNGVIPDPVTPSDAIALIRRLVTTGAEMIAAFGNCGSPRQQAASTAFGATIADAQAALAAIDAP